jgi:hypothetical protein
MEFPAGTSPGPYNFKFFNADVQDGPAVVVNSPVPSCSVSLEAGNWTCVAVRLNEAQDAELGDSASVTFIVPTAATVVIGVVGSVEVSVSETVKTVKKVSVK